MERKNYFFVIFLLTIVVVRVFLYLHPVSGPTFTGIRVHHYAYGILAIIISFFFSSLTLFAVGLAFFIDELTYLLIGGTTHQDNYSLVSLAGTVGFSFLVFFIRGFLAKLIRSNSPQSPYKPL